MPTRRMPLLYDAFLLLATASMLFGIVFLSDQPGQRNAIGYQTARDVMPLQAWGAIFLALGIGIAIAIALLRRWLYVAVVMAFTGGTYIYWAVLLAVTAVSHQWNGAIGAVAFGFVGGIALLLTRAAVRQVGQP